MELKLIEVEGIDKCGKDTLIGYINQLSNFKYVVHSRGILSNMVYADKYNRYFNHILTYKPIIVYLTVEKEDWIIRCNLSNEPIISYEEDIKLFNIYKNKLKENGIIIFEYNTSKITPYEIAKDVINKIDNLVIMRGN